MIPFIYKNINNLILKYINVIVVFLIFCILYGCLKSLVEKNKKRLLVEYTQEVLNNQRNNAY